MRTRCECKNININNLQGWASVDVRATEGQIVCPLMREWPLRGMGVVGCNGHGGGDLPVAKRCR